MNVHATMPLAFEGLPEDEMQVALILLVVGYPAEACVVPAIGKKPP